MKGLLAVILGAALVTSDQTVWWRTADAAVIGFHSPNECAMFLYNNVRAVVITWGKNNQKLGIEDRSLQLTSPEPVPVAVQIGPTWIGDPNKPNLMAYGSGDYVTLPLEQPRFHLGAAQDEWLHFIDHLLVSADHVTFKMLNTQITYETPRGKLPALLAAADSCRKLIR